MEVNIVIKGLVQGVSFRYYTQLEASKIRLEGTVRNLDDGTVFIEAQGNKKEIMRLIDWCHRGSPNAKVEEITVIINKVKKTFLGFKIIK